MNPNYRDTEIFESMPVAKALAKMAIPTILGQIIVLIYNMADTFYVGKTDNPYMVAGVSLILPVFNILIALAGLPSAGGGTRVSSLLGMGRRSEAAKVTSYSIWMGLILSAVFSVLMAVFMEPILKMLGAGENTMLFAKQYVLCVIVLGGVPTVLSNILSNLLRSTGRSGEAGLGVALGGILNIALDPLFMFVLLPKGSEILGVGIATLLSNVISCVYYAVVLIRQRKHSVISLRPAMPDKESIRAIFNVGMPSFIAMLLFDVDYMIIDRLMVGYSDIALAAMGIVLKAERLPLNVGVGIAQGMSPMVAYSYSAKNYDRMTKTYRLARLWGIVTALISVVLYELFAGGIIRFFIRDAETVELGAAFLRARSPAAMFMFLSFFVVHLFQSFGKGGTALYLGIQRWMFLNIPIMLLLNTLFGITGMVWAQFVGDVINVILSFVIFGSYRRRTLLPEQKRQESVLQG